MIPSRDRDIPDNTFDVSYSLLYTISACRYNQPHYDQEGAVLTAATDAFRFGKKTQFFMNFYNPIFLRSTLDADFEIDMLRAIVT